VIIVLHIEPAKMDRYRALIARVDASPERKDAMIRAVGALMQTFVDIAFGSDSVQIIEQKRIKDSFQAATLNVSLTVSESAEQIDLADANTIEGGSKGAITTKQSHDLIEKDNRDGVNSKNNDHQGSHLLPRQ
jgi:hypothetical protein